MVTPGRGGRAGRYARACAPGPVRSLGAQDRRGASDADAADRDDAISQAIGG